MIKINDNNHISEVSLYGKCEQRNLSAGYQQVEYLESSGTQYIDTGIIPSEVDNIYIKFKNTASTQGYLIGAAGGGFYNYVGVHNAFPGYGENWGGQNQFIGFGIPVDTSNIHTIIADLTSTPKFYFDGELKATQIEYATISSTYTLKINEKVFNSNTRCSARYYSVKLSKSGSFIRYLIPARRLSDNVLGMYDTVTNTFLTNQGTGTFIAGPDVVSPTPDNPIDIVCNNGAIKVSRNLFDKNNSPYIIAYVSTATGQITQGTTQYCFVLICKPNTTYTLSGMSAESGWGSFESTTIGSVTNVLKVGNATITTGSNDHYLVGLAYTTDGRVDYRDTLQIEEGSVATPYHQYREIYTEGTQETLTDNLGNSATAEMLLSVGDYKDIQKVVEGSVNRKVGIKVLDGSESWQMYGGTTGDNGKLFYSDAAVIGNLLGVSSLLVISNYFHAGAGGGEVVHFTNGDCRFQQSASTTHATTTNRIYLATLHQNLTAFTTWLTQQYNAGTPVIIIYPLADPTSESVTPQSLPGKTVTQTAGSIPNMDFDVSYLHSLVDRYVGSSMVKKVYNGQNLVHLHLKDNTPFTKRITCNGAIGEVVDVTGKIESIKGNTLVWNQEVGLDDVVRGNDNTGISIQDSVLEVTKLSNSTFVTFAIASGADIQTSHRYYICATMRGNSMASCHFASAIGAIDGNEVMSVETSNFVRKSIITSPAINSTYFICRAGTTASPSGTTAEFKDIMCIDLTKMFGAGNEPSTVEEFEKLFPEAYYSYSEPKLLSFCPQTSIPVTNLIDGDFSSASDWEAPIATTFTVANNQGTFTMSQAVANATALAQSLGTIAAGTYYVACKIKSSVTRNCSVNIGTNIITTDAVQTNSSDFTIVDTLQVISSDISLGYFYITLNDSVAANEYVTLEEAWLVKVPAGTTKAQAREMVYNSGGISASAVLKSVGFNQWDEEWELGAISFDDGRPTVTQSGIRTKKYINVVQGTSYYFKTPDYMWATAYDVNKNYIGALNNRSSFGNVTLTMPANTCYIKFWCRPNYGTTYNHDICINLSDPKRNGTYKPYEEDTVELPISTLTGKLNGEGDSVVVFPDGLRSVGSVHDEIVGNKAIKRIGSVDLGTFDYTYVASADNPYFRFLITNIQRVPTGRLNYICAKYNSISPTTSYDMSTNTSDKIITRRLVSSAEGSNFMYVRDVAYSDVNAFKNAVSGVMLYYELATPREYILDDFQLPINYNANGLGTEEIILEGTSSPTTTPANMDIEYRLRN